VPEAQRRPIIQSHPVAQPRHMPAASGFSQKQQRFQQNGKGRQAASPRNRRG
jgi:hypothetical protein